jgi:asparagine synthase (glutamine-hydrolysing)
MCGICGVVSFGGTRVDPDVLHAMNETLVHRGPDSAGAFVDGRVGLAARRLAIIDLDGGDQPIANEDGSVQVVQNGEIYNHAELRAELESEGHRFSTDHSDTEVLVHLYEERGVSRRYETDHHELLVRPDAVELLPRLAEVFDEPFADASAIPTYLVSKLARQHVKVALSGEGGDELFGGYNYYVGHVLAGRFGPAAGFLRLLVERRPSSSKQASTFDNKAKRLVRGASLAPLERHLAFKQIFSVEQRAQLFLPGVNGARPPLDFLRAQFDASEGAEDLARFMHVDLGIYLVEDMLVKTNRASMANSLEARVPILDTVVAELALSLPSRLKVRGFSKKRLVRRAMEPLLPKEVLQGPKKGFAIPIAAWLRGELEPFAREALSPEVLRRQGFFRPDAGTALFDAHVARRDDYSRQLWALLMFSLWFDRYGGGARAG